MLPQPAVSLAIIVSALAVAGAFSIGAQQPDEATLAAAGITYPVAELGNCADKDACHAYCNEPARLEACIAFAKSHGLMNAAEVDRAERFAREISGDGGPGGCRTPQACEAFCHDIRNLDVCVGFAREFGVPEDEIAQAKRIAAHLKGGGTMPGSCTSRESCEAYCGDFTHAEECLAFAEQVGLEIKHGGATKDPAEFRKFLELMKRGETPGGCTSERSCREYCEAPGRFEECMAFAERAGFIPPEAAAKLRALGGKGPGGCSSPQTCEAFCSDAAHREECFTFAEEHGLVGAEELRSAKEGLVQLRAGLANVPPEVRACVESALGQNVIEDTAAGRLTPGPEIGERMRSCFEKFGESRDFGKPFEDAPPEVTTCLNEKLGGSAFDAIRHGTAAPTPETADAFRVCFEQFRFTGGGGGEGPLEGDDHGAFFRTAPPEIESCLRERLGDRYEQLKAGEIDRASVESEIRHCFESFRPPTPHPGEGQPFPGGDDRGGPPGEAGEQYQREFQQQYEQEFQRQFQGEVQHQLPSGGVTEPSGSFPPEVVACLRSQVPAEALELLLRGSQPGPGLEPIISSCYGALRTAPQPPPDSSLPTEPLPLPVGPSTEGGQLPHPPGDFPQPPTGIEPPPPPPPPPPASRAPTNPLGLILAPFLELLR